MIQPLFWAGWFVPKFPAGKRAAHRSEDALALGGQGGKPVEPRSGAAVGMVA